MLLLMRFLQKYRQGAEPAHALAAAQGWLSGATNAQISAAFPDLYGAPDIGSTGVRASWERRVAFAEPHNWATFSYSGA